MSNFTSVCFSEDDLGLALLTTIVQQGEQIRRSLAGDDSCQHFARRLACFTHERTDAPLRPLNCTCPDGEIPTIPGKTLVCIGNCFVESRLRMVAAFR